MSSEHLQKIENALRGYLSPQQVAAAKDLWLTEFSSHANFVPFAFARKLATGFAFDAGQIREITRRLKDLVYADATPARTSTAYRAIPASPSFTQPQSASPHLLLDDRTMILNAILERVLKRFVVSRPEVADSLIKHLHQHLSEMKLSLVGKALIENWMKSLKVSPALLGSGLEVDEMSALVHSIYLWASMEVGPRADHHFSQILKDVEDLPEATNFNPRTLF